MVSPLLCHVLITHAEVEETHERRPHQERWCYGKTPMQTFVDSGPLAKERILAGGVTQADSLTVR